MTTGFIACRRIVVAAVASLACAATVVAQPRADPQTSMADFTSRIAAYVELTNRATDQIRALRKTDDPKEIVARQIAFASAITAARTEARRGDIFTPAIARVFQRVIKKDFRSRPKRGQHVMLDEIPHFHPKVNQTYPSEWPLATFPATLLATLPTLPEGLEYRLLSEALILLDVRANVIVDFVLDVL